MKNIFYLNYAFTFGYIAMNTLIFFNTVQKCQNLVLPCFQPKHFVVSKFILKMYISHSRGATIIPFMLFLMSVMYYI